MTAGRIVAPAREGYNVAEGYESLNRATFFSIARKRDTIHSYIMTHFVLHIYMESASCTRKTEISRFSRDTSGIRFTRIQFYTVEIRWLMKKAYSHRKSTETRNLRSSDREFSRNEVTKKNCATVCEGCSCVSPLIRNDSVKYHHMHTYTWKIRTEALSNLLSEYNFFFQTFAIYYRTRCNLIWLLLLHSILFYEKFQIMKKNWYRIHVYIIETNKRRKNGMIQISMSLVFLLLI